MAETNAVGTLTPIVSFPKSILTGGGPVHAVIVRSDDDCSPWGGDMDRHGVDTLCPLCFNSDNTEGATSFVIIGSDKNFDACCLRLTSGRDITIQFDCADETNVRLMFRKRNFNNVKVRDKVVIDD